MRSIFIVGHKGKLENKTGFDGIEVSGFTKYLLKLDGKHISETDETARKLMLSISADGYLTIQIEESDDEVRPIESSIQVPEGFAKFHEARASKMIRGALGRYIYYKNDKTKEYLAVVISSANNRRTINLGSLNDPNSTISIVLKNIPDKPFYKAQLNTILPNYIVENRQPVKAALDVLEKEKFIAKTGSKQGIAEEYIRTDKPIPKMTSIDNYAS
ncbi:MAG: hypothetical protein HMLIMOIP_001948 [Candidatus Nitrosomirales archaeon]|jgi:hypothetical protein